MSARSITLLAGLFALFAGERLLSGYDALRWTADGVGVVLLAACAGLSYRAYRGATDPGRRFALRVVLACLLGAAVGLVLYAGTTTTVTKALGLASEGLRRYRGVVGALWPIAVLASVLPFLALDATLHRNPVVLPVAQVRHVLAAALSAALGTAWVFPADYIAARKNHRFDLTHFRTTEAGTATKNLAAALEAPLNVRIFMPPASEVTDELLGYFRQIEGPNLTVEVMDLAAHPKLARALRVRENGVVAITRGEVVLDEGAQEKPAGERPVTRTIQVGTTLDRAKRTLKKLDGEVQRILLELGQSERKVYLTAGHGEMGWTGTRPPEESLKGLRKLLEALHFDVETLSLAAGLGDAVPDDADLVIVAGPKEAFHPAEIAALRAYLARGGALLLALEPAAARSVARLLDLPAPEAAAGGPADEPASGRSPAARTGGQAPDEPAADRPASGGEPKPAAPAPAADPAKPAPKAGGGDPLGDLLADLGLSLGEGVLAAEGGYVPLYHAKLDRANLVTDRFSIHPSTTVMAEYAGRLLLFTPTSGFLERRDAPTRKVVFTVRSLPIAWADLDGDFELDTDAGEAKRERPIVAAVEPSAAGATPFRAVVAADASFLSDLALGNLGNQQFIHDTINWLIGAEALSGRTESEEDVKIEHTKEDQAKWFYATVLGVPVLVLAGGGLHVRRRRKGSK